MAKLSHHIEYWLALLGTKLVQPMSFATADRFGARLGSIAHALLPSRRRIAFDNLKQGMGDSLSDDAIEAIVKRVFENIGRTMVEFARLGQVTPETARQFIIGDVTADLDRVIEEGRGAVIVTGHFGNWEMAGAYLSSRGYPVDYLVGTQHNKKVDEMFIGFRKQLNVGIISVKKSIRSIFKALRSNRLVALVSDQHDPGGGVILEFFGRRAATPKGPAAFAVKAGCPILAYMTRRERYDRHVVMACPPIYPPRSDDEEKDMETMTVAYTKFFEDCIRQYPDQWMWTHRRWKLG